MVNDMLDGGPAVDQLALEGNTTTSSAANTSRGDNTGDDCYASVDEACPTGVACQDLDAECLQCDFDHHCTYHSQKLLPAQCRPKPGINCTVSLFFLNLLASFFKHEKYFRQNILKDSFLCIFIC